MENKLQQEIQKSVTPFIFRVVVIITIIGGILGLLFFSSVIYFQIDGSNFPGYFQYKDEYGIVFTTFLVLQILIHLGFIISAIQLLKNKRLGIYTFLFCFMLFIISRLYYTESFIYVELFSGLLLFGLMVLNWKKLK